MSRSPLGQHRHTQLNPCSLGDFGTRICLDPTHVLGLAPHVLSFQSTRLSGPYQKDRLKTLRTVLDQGVDMACSTQSRATISP
jgi:hypothetical protein